MADLYCLVHEDDHVIAFANTPGGAAYLEAALSALTELRISGYRLASLGHDEACRLRIAADGCPVCRVELPCGCEPREARPGGSCQHWSEEQQERIGAALAGIAARKVIPQNLR